MPTISSSNLTQCEKYCNSIKIFSSAYGEFLKILTLATQKDYPVEILNDQTDTISKVLLKDFTLSYEENREGDADKLAFSFTLPESQDIETLTFSKIGRGTVRKYLKNSSRTFYRFFLDGDNKEEYRFTFNRRVTKK